MQQCRSNGDGQATWKIAALWNGLKLSVGSQVLSSLQSQLSQSWHLWYLGWLQNRLNALCLKGSAPTEMRGTLQCGESNPFSSSSSSLPSLARFLSSLSLCVCVSLYVCPSVRPSVRAPSVSLLRMPLTSNDVLCAMNLCNDPPPSSWVSFFEGRTTTG